MNLDWRVMWCDKHLRPLKKHWPKGAALAMLGLFEAAVKNPEIIRRCGGSEGHLANADNLSLVLNSIKPVCCFLPDDQVREIVRLALQGKKYEGGKE